MSNIPTQFHGVTVVAKANVYFDGGVVSHTVLLPGEVKKTLGLIRPGTYYFTTGAPERMEIISGECVVKLDGSITEATYSSGSYFDVPGKSGFNITVKSGLCEYICSFLS
jgi:purine/pyrimidine-nucleoside phosphorylase